MPASSKDKLVATISQASEETSLLIHSQSVVSLDRIVIDVEDPKSSLDELFMKTKQSKSHRHSKLIDSNRSSLLLTT